MSDRLKEAVHRLIDPVADQLEDSESGLLLGYDSSRYLCLPKRLLRPLKALLHEEANAERDQEFENLIFDIVSGIEDVIKSEGELNQKLRERLRSNFRRFADYIKE